MVSRQMNTIKDKRINSSTFLFFLSDRRAEWDKFGIVCVYTTYSFVYDVVLSFQMKEQSIYIIIYTCSLYTYNYILLIIFFFRRTKSSG